MPGLSQLKKTTLPTAYGNGGVRERRRKLPWVWAIVTLLVLGGLAWALLLSPWFKIAKVSVTGIEKLDGAAIAEAAGIMDTSILLVDANAMERALKGRFPLIREATLNRFFPNEVVITVKERRPWADWQVADKKWVIDEDGVVIAASARSELPTIVDMDRVAVQLGDQVDATSLPLAKRLIEALPKEVGAKAASFEYLRNGGLVVITDKGWRARFGNAEDWEYKLAVWKSLLSKRAAGEIAFQHVDLRFGYRPFVR